MLSDLTGATKEREESVRTLRFQVGQTKDSVMLTENCRTDLGGDNQNSVFYFLFFFGFLIHQFLMHVTLCDPMDFSQPGSSVHENLQARILE